MEKKVDNINFANWHNLNAKYRIIKKIGIGGMSRVFLAVDKIKNTKVAVKIFYPDFSVDFDIAKQRFKNEIEITRKINSQHIVKILDFNYLETEKYIVMEYVEGCDLMMFLEKHGPLEENFAIDIGIKILKGLYDIHQKGIYHRDIKSSNILIDQNKRIKIIDFGISLDEKTQRYTKENNIIGSPHYLAPEIIKTGGYTFTKFSEIYAIGVLLFEMVIGRTPFNNQNQNEIIKNILLNEIPEVNKINPRISQAFANIVLKATNKDPEKRYATLREMIFQLEKAAIFKNEAKIIFKKQKKTTKNKKKTFFLFLIFFLTVSLILNVFLFFSWLQN